MTQRAMTTWWSSIFSAAGIYAALAIVMGVFPGTVLSKAPAGPASCPSTRRRRAAETLRRRRLFVLSHATGAPAGARSRLGPRVGGRRLRLLDSAAAGHRTNRAGLTKSAPGSPARCGSRSTSTSRARSFTDRSCRRIPGCSSRRRAARASGRSGSAGYAPAGKVIVATRQEQDLVAYSLAQTSPLPAPRHHHERHADGPPAGGDAFGTIVVIAVRSRRCRLSSSRSARRFGPARTDAASQALDPPGRSLSADASRQARRRRSGLA